MVKSELINHLHRKQSHIPFKDMESGVNNILEYLSLTLAEGRRIEIRGFGSFSRRHRPPRQAHNPKTGAWAYTKEKYTPHFKPGKDLRDRVNANRTQFPIKTDHTDRMADDEE